MPNRATTERLARDCDFNGIKTFSVTMVADRKVLGEMITEWMMYNPQCEVRQAVVTQSSDSAFHCIVITLFYWEDLGSA